VSGAPSRASRPWLLRCLRDARMIGEVAVFGSSVFQGGRQSPSPPLLCRVTQCVYTQCITTRYERKTSIATSTKKKSSCAVMPEAPDRTTSAGYQTGAISCRSSHTLKTHRRLHPG
jgi:hypothetical protein